MPVKLTPRLLTAARYVRGGLVADVGTDHAYLPIYLVETGRVAPTLTPTGEMLSAIASDINEGPVERAAIHVAAAGLSDRIRTVRTDGLTGLDVHDPSDIVIFGMGGELIAAILAAAPWARRPGKRLILQPMTHADRLRAYLDDAGLSVVAETLSAEGERIYQTLCVEVRAPGDAITPHTPGERAVGRLCHRAGDAEQMGLCRALIDKTLRTETAARDARRAAGQAVDESDALIASLRAMLTQIEYDQEGSHHD